MCEFGGYITFHTRKKIIVDRDAAAAQSAISPVMMRNEKVIPAKQNEKSPVTGAFNNI